MPGSNVPPTETQTVSTPVSPEKESKHPAAPGALPSGAPRSSHISLWLLTRSATWIFLILVGIVITFSVLRPEAFATVANLRNIAVDASILMVLAIGATFVILTGEIDLSVGSVLVFSGMVGAKLMESLGGNSLGVILLGLIACLASGLAWGFVNGFLVGKARIPSFIVTLGTLGMALGLALIINDGLDVRDIPLGLVETLGIEDFLGQIPYLALVAAAVVAIAALLLGGTRFGRYTYAIGSNAEAARRAGVNVSGHVVKVFALAGLLSGLAGFLSLARFGTTTVSGHITDNFQAIAAVVLGGTSLFGGVGSIWGTVVGVFIPVVLANGLVILGVQAFWQQVAVGAILVSAVYLDQWRRAHSQRE